jgi:hypothetical protein
MKEIKSISDVSEIKNKQNLIFYRGQSSDKELSPLLTRGLKDEDKLDKLKDKEIESLKYLKSLLPNLKWNWWQIATIAQHYGIPTRLLDWSEDPHVGLFFAVRNKQHDDKDGVFWVFENTSGIAGFCSEYDENLEKLTKLNYPSIYRAYRDFNKKNLKNDQRKDKEKCIYVPRVHLQKGALSWQPDLTKSFDKQNFNLEKQCIHKYIVPKNCKEKIRKELNNKDVKDLRLFPDCLFINNEVIINLPNKLFNELVGLVDRIRHYT